MAYLPTPETIPARTIGNRTFPALLKWYRADGTFDLFYQKIAPCLVQYLVATKQLGLYCGEAYDMGYPPLGGYVLNKEDGGRDIRFDYWWAAGRESGTGWGGTGITFLLRNNLNYVWYDFTLGAGGKGAYPIAWQLEQVKPDGTRVSIAPHHTTSGPGYGSTGYYGVSWGNPPFDWKDTYMLQGLGHWYDTGSSGSWAQGQVGFNFIKRIDVDSKIYKYYT